MDSVLEQETYRATRLAEIRRRCAPEPNEPGSTRRRCRDCGEWFWDWSREGYRPCADCSANRRIAASTQRSAKRGPAYERTVRAMLKHWLGEAQRLGITPDP